MYVAPQSPLSSSDSFINISSAVLDISPDKHTNSYINNMKININNNNQANYKDKILQEIFQQQLL